MYNNLWLVILIEGIPWNKSKNICIDFLGLLCLSLLLRFITMAIQAQGTQMKERIMR